MKTALFSVTCVVVAAFALASEDASASTNSHHSSSSHMSHRTFSFQGRSFSTRTYSRSYTGWSRYCWFPGYRCYGYYCPTDYCWYFYSPTNSCYVPVTYLGQVAPEVVNTNANLNTNSNVNTNINVNTNGLPVGATALPVGVAPGGLPAPK
jgi:hypothetical protein